MVTRLLSPSKCVPAWQEALKAGKVGISDCYAASKLEEKEQAELLALKLNGNSRDAIEQAGRRNRTKAAHAVRLSRVKIAMPQGASVVVSGNDLSMSDVVELLAETLKEARKAAEQCDVKTFQSMMKDKAKG
jgi:ParB family transcriptional regulator, chromosome partitioning protein